MNIDEMRKLEFVGNWYRPHSKGTYMNMTKNELVEHLAVAFHNWREAELALKRSSNYAEILQNKLRRADVVSMAYHKMTVKGVENGRLTITGLDVLQEAVDDYDGVNR